MMAKNSFSGDIFNICSGLGYSVPDIVENYQIVSGKKITPKYISPSSYWDKFPGLFVGHPFSKDRIVKEVYKNSIGNPQKAYDILGFKAKTSLNDGLAKVFKFSNTQLADKCS